MAVHGGDGDRIAEAEGIELIYGGVLRTGGVGLVHGEHNGLAGAQEHIGNVLIRGGDAESADIGDEDDNGGGVYGDLRLLAHIEQYFAVGGRLDAAGIDHIELAAAPLALGIEPVAVTPGVSSTMLSLRPTRRLKSIDLPTFGRPTIATRGLDIQFPPNNYQYKSQF